MKNGAFGKAGQGAKPHSLSSTGRSPQLTSASRKTLARTEGGATKGAAGNRKGNPFGSDQASETVRRKTDASHKKKRPGAREDESRHAHMLGAGHSRTTRAGGKRSRRLGSRK